VDRKNNFARVREDIDQFEDDDGCPDPDNDKDGFPDQRDRCPDHPETLNCYQDGDGCPDDILHITDKVLFKTDSASLRRGARPLLKYLAALVLGAPSILRLRVEGHTDVRGRVRYNDKLSLRRARKVMKAIVRLGVDPSRVEAVGYGERCPVGVKHLRNRRVVFRVVCPVGPGATVRLSKRCPPAAALRTGPATTRRLGRGKNRRKIPVKKRQSAHKRLRRKRRQTK
jgi:outer membrane protein OmpA-like peptidoglycan-associated protein